jgi:hypothetical protein
MAHVRRNYPVIHQELTKLYPGEKRYCQTFKTSLEEYWPDKYERKVQLSRIRNAWDQEQSRKTRGTKSLSIQLDYDVKKQFSAFVKHYKLTQAEFIEELLHHYNQPQGEIDLFKTKEQRVEATQKEEAFDAKIADLKQIVAGRNKDIAQLKVQLENEKNSAKVKQQGGVSNDDDVFLKAYEEHVLGQNK